jgi:P4 family phage/plasmid primase-like protien
LATDGFINWDHLQSQLVAACKHQADKLQHWAGSMGFTVEACQWLGIGYLKDKNAWTWPERDADGVVVGIGCRHRDSGRKWMVTGSSHGLIYAPDPDFGGWPAYIDHPILILEGATDVLACLSRNIYACGRPSAKGTSDSNAWLEILCRDRDIALVCENDEGVGAVAFLDFVKPLSRRAKRLWTVTPPPHYKDLREWLLAEKQAGVDEIEEQIRMRRPWQPQDYRAISGDIILDDAPLRVAETMKHEHYWSGSDPTLRLWNGRWYRYTGSAYEVMDDAYVRRDVYHYLDGKKLLKDVTPKGRDDRKYEEQPYRPDMRKVTQIIDALKATNDILVDPNTEMPSWLDGGAGRPMPENMIAFKNGILDVERYVKKMRIKFDPPSPQWFSQTYCPYEFDATNLRYAKPALDYIREVFNDDEDSIHLFQEWGGYCMVPDNSMEKMMLMVGRPSAGKGTLLDILTGVIGPANIYSTRLDDIGSKFGLYGALGKTNIFMPDAHVTQFDRCMASLEVIKTITGQGAINIEGKNINPVSQILRARFTINVNQLPDLKDSSAALRRRLNILWFPNSYEGKADPALKRKLTRPEIIAGMAVWFMEGLRRLRLARAFTQPSVSRAIAKEFERVNTPVAAFIMQECVVGAGHAVEKQRLFHEWSLWAKSHGLSPGAASTFGQRLLACLPVVKSGRSNRDRHGRRFSQYEGLRLRTVMDEDPD